MSGNSSSDSQLTLSAWKNSWQDNSVYFDMLKAVCQLSRLFSENSVPYIDYRVVENLFCRYYKATNYARECTSFDAGLGNLGVGIKTFILGKNHNTEKVAEFNHLRNELDGLTGIELAKKLGELRNERIDFSLRAYNISEKIYHIIGRKDSSLMVFNHVYPCIDLHHITDVKQGRAGSVSFYDGSHHYRFNNSKSVLMMQFDIPEDEGAAVVIDTPILEDPYQLLEQLLKRGSSAPSLSSQAPRIKGADYVILPLYSTKGTSKHVPEKSGLNQWNASGRQRDPDEVYLPIPKMIHRLYPDFFPPRDQPFTLDLPDGQHLQSKVCQQDGKALMSNPNSALGKWILRDVLNIAEGELVTYETLQIYGIDSILIEKKHPDGHENEEGTPRYSLKFVSGNYEDYDEFVSEDEE